MPKQELFTSPASNWTRADDVNSDVVVSSRVRLARNLADTLFVGHQSVEQRQATLQKIKTALAELGQKDLTFYDYRDLPELQREVLVEKHLASPNHIADAQAAGVIISDRENIAVMLNEEDHLRIQSLYPGLQLRTAYADALATEQLLAQKLTLAFSRQLGYLTACPSNVGTGLRASVMLHLPALAMTKQLKRILGSLPQLGLVVRGLYGEGSESAGHLYQISNQRTLGMTDEQLLDLVEDIASQLMEKERQARVDLMQRNQTAMEDYVWRTYGVLAYARSLSGQELMEKLSALRFGVSLGMLHNITQRELNELMIGCGRVFLQLNAANQMSMEERDVARADKVRELLSKAR